LTLFLSKMTLSKSPSTQALASLLDPKERGRAMDAHHRLVWSAFAGDPDADRDFLWRHDAAGVFYTLSARAPVASAFFNAIEVKPFSLALNVGDRLAFMLRANATRSLSVDWPADGSRPRGKRVDIVADVIKRNGDGAMSRDEAAKKAAGLWMTEQGRVKGFSVEGVAVEHFGSYAISDRANKRKGQPQLGVLDMHGQIKITDPEAFKCAYTQGFGRGKAFGCGMMMIRRA
jgi:CRISPR system Cascade subunit CasE